ALSTVVPSHLMDRDLFNFRDLQMDGVANPNGDIAFDDDPCATPAGSANFIPLQMHR
ncbi:MAG: tRNA 2-thiocytidine(32) synthetase TtcA, partial [Oxalobacteraceae bacterium]